MNIQIEIDPYQEDAIVAESLKQSYKSVKKSDDGWPEDKQAMLKALRVVYHYYTSKTLK